MAQLDNSLKHNRSKQIVYWNLEALANLHSLSQMMVHHAYPQLHTLKDRDWCAWFYTARGHVRGRPEPETFLGKSRRYIFGGVLTFDKLALNKAHLLDLMIAQDEFWTKIKDMVPRTKEQYKSQKLVRQILNGYRKAAYPVLALLTLGINRVIGIHKLKPSSQLSTFLVLVVLEELFIRYGKSAETFYRIPELPDPQLERERLDLLNESLVIDGRINTYGRPDKDTLRFLDLAAAESTLEGRREILEALGYKIINRADLL